MGLNIHFYCELSTPDLVTLLQDRRLIQLLQKLRAGICLATLDFSPERAEAVKFLNQAGIPVTAWLILPKLQGYWSNLDNAAQTQNRYMELISWTMQNGLFWAAIGLDIEPDISLIQAIFARRWIALLPNFVKSFVPGRLSNARRIYQNLASRIHADGYILETYQFPLIADDRLGHSKMIQRVLGIMDVPSDREVFMLYSSFLRPWGSGILWSYGQGRAAPAIGSCGGGVDLPNGVDQPLTWDEFQRDLHLAWGLNENIYIFSLEGCQRQDFLERLAVFEWDQLILEPAEASRQVDKLRLSIQVFLWIFSHYYIFFGLGFIIALLLYPRNRAK